MVVLADNWAKIKFFLNKTTLFIREIFKNSKDLRNNVLFYIFIQAQLVQLPAKSNRLVISHVIYVVGGLLLLLMTHYPENIIFGFCLSTAT